MTAWGGKPAEPAELDIQIAGEPEREGSYRVLVLLHAGFNECIWYA